MTREKTVLELTATDPLICLPPDATIQQAAQEMLRHHIGAVLIVENGQTIGIVTERDINYRAVATGKDSSVTPLAAIMTREPTMIPPETKASDALRQVVRNRFRYALVGRDGIAAGIVVISRIFAEVAKHLGSDVEDIENFIRSGAYSGHSSLN